MIGHSSILLIILIAYSAYSFGVLIPYKNDSYVYFSMNETISITCTGTDEVTWFAAYSAGGNYTVKAETPYRKVLQIRNATEDHTGMYVCASTKNRKESMRISVHCDDSCFIDPETGKRMYTWTDGIMTIRSSNKQHIDDLWRGHGQH
ncbi:uncharacterized protein LOC135846312 isoform X1 [Planococcus citri]|uniref:uncharacterized protein LOC135846312 isoform X1 n=1 Tax=Planococcus citri TaxID=170843 RepID=UPI0031F99440